MNKLALLGLALLCLASCDMMLSTITIKSNGITYEVPFQKQSAISPSVVTEAAPAIGKPGVATKTETGFTFAGELTTIKELNGNLTVNGKEFGTVKTGDTVRIDKAGKVSVNGTPRTSP